MHLAITLARTAGEVALGLVALALALALLAGFAFLALSMASAVLLAAAQRYRRARHLPPIE